MTGQGTAGVVRILRRAARPAARAVRRVGRRRELRDAVDTICRARGMRVVLTYHRVAPRTTPCYEVVPTVPYNLFREQLAAFGELGEIVPLETLVDAPAGGGEPLRLALTFDDDYTSHARYVLPTLQDLDLRGTFFLSGRALHGLGGYWFQRLEALLADQGLPATAALLDLPDTNAPQLPLRCEGDARRVAMIEEHAPSGDPPIDAERIRALGAAGMTIGFHTVHHPVLPGLDDHALEEALTIGRESLAALIGHPLEWFAYPHGKADSRTVSFTRRAGYTAAWTTQPRPLRSHDDRHQLGRWEPQPLATDDVLTRFARFVQRFL